MNKQSEFSPTHIIIFAKAPLPGFAKTRLIPVLGEKGAAELANEMLDFAIDESLKSELGTVELCVTPNREHSFWTHYSRKNKLILTNQGEGDLGIRMAHAAKRALETHRQILLIGTDCPGIDRIYLRKASLALSQTDACIAEVSDGGYALLGLSRFDASLFESIPWSTDQVFSLTKQRFQAMGWSVSYLPVLHDIDEAEDLKHLPIQFKRTPL